MSGSYIAGYSGFYEQDYEFALKVGDVSELALGNSKHSLGLQIADYFATFAYQYFKDDQGFSYATCPRIGFALQR